MRTVVYGTGATGARAARQLVSGGAEHLTLIDQNVPVAEAAASSLGSAAVAMTVSALRLETRLERFGEACADADLAILTASDDHAEMAEVALRRGVHVVSVSDDIDTVQELLELDQVARDAGRSMVVGAGFAPGLTCLLARHAANRLDVVDEIHVAKFGTGGPACARQHHRALRSDALDWRNQRWERRRGGTGRELCWFPDPVGGRDCYQAALPDPLLIQSAFSGVIRSSARLAATRRDMSTKWLPMLRRPHPEGAVGAVRVEVRGWSDVTRDAVIFGALDRPAAAAGTVAAVAGMWAVEGRYDDVGAGGLARLLADPVAMLQALADRGVRAAVFEGSHHDRSN